MLIDGKVLFFLTICLTQIRWGVFINSPWWIVDNCLANCSSLGNHSRNHLNHFPYFGISTATQNYKVLVNLDFDIVQLIFFFLAFLLVNQILFHEA